MAVQAHNHPSALIDLQKRPLQLCGTMEDKSLAIPIPFFYGSCEQTGAVAAGGKDAYAQQQTYFHSGLNANNILFQSPAPKVPPNATALGARKRRKPATQQSRKHPQPVTFMPSDITPSMNVSTGLRLAFDDERSTITTSLPELASGSLSFLHDQLSTQLCQQQKDLNELISSQTDQLKQVLDEKRQLQSKALLAAIEESVSRRLKEREMELDMLNRRTMELEERAKYLNMECHLWQSKAKSSEAMVAVLKSNLQQAMAQSREQMSKEGCGDSEVDDAASATYALGDCHGARKPVEHAVRTCKTCNAKEASVLLLPCLHLCLCVDCLEHVSRCPVCQSVSSATVQVYLS